MATKDEFLTRIAARLGRSPVGAVPATPAPTLPRRPPLPAAERVERFVIEARATGTVVAVCPTLADAQENLRGILETLAPEYILTWSDDALPGWSLDTILDPRKRIPPDHLEYLLRAAEAEVGITGVDAAVADTGTLVLATGKGKPRLPSLLPRAHIALVWSRQIVTYLEDAWQPFGILASTNQPSAVQAISGPSRSADIENDLSIGVHGPASVYVLIVEAEK